MPSTPAIGDSTARGGQRLTPESAAPDAPAIDASGLRLAIVSDAAPERNGVGAYYRDLAEHLRARGARVELISPRFRGGRWHGGLAMPLPGDPTQRFLIPPPGLLAKRLDRLQPQAVIIPTPGPYGMLGMLLARRRGLDLVVGFHTHFERLASLNHAWKLPALIAQTYLNACNRQLFRASRLVLANSRDMVEIARSIGARHVGLMGTPIPRQFLDAPTHPLRKDIRRVLFAGRLAPEKNLQAIVAAAAALPDLEFLIAGDGPLRSWVEEQTSHHGNLRYLGWIKRAQLLPLLDDTDVLALPSTVESFGTIALEAMARARLVVVSADCGILSWELLKRGLFQMRPAEQLGDVLQRIRALDHALREKKAALARAAARDINDRNLNHWLDILVNGARRGLDEPDAA